MILQHIGVLSSAKMLGAVYAGMGLIFGFFISLISLFSSMIPGAGGDFGAAGAFYGMLLGAGAIIFAPIFYGLMGFFGGAVAALIYNLVARFAGGLELVLVERPVVGGLGNGTGAARRWVIPRRQLRGSARASPYGMFIFKRYSRSVGRRETVCR